MSKFHSWQGNGSSTSSIWPKKNLDCKCDHGFSHWYWACNVILKHERYLPYKKLTLTVSLQLLTKVLFGNFKCKTNVIYVSKLWQNARKQSKTCKSLMPSG